MQRDWARTFSRTAPISTFENLNPDSSSIEAMTLPYETNPLIDRNDTGYSKAMKRRHITLLQGKALHCPTSSTS